MFYMGAMYANDTSPSELKDHDYDGRLKKTGAGVTATCYEMYARMKSGISAEEVSFNAGGSEDFHASNPVNIERPETVESMMYLWRYTHEPRWREMGWKIFQAFEKNTKVA